VIVPGGLTRLYTWPEAAENLVPSPGAGWHLHSAFTWDLAEGVPTGALQLDMAGVSGVTPSAWASVRLEPAWYVLRARAWSAGNTPCLGSARVMLKIGGAIGPSTDVITGEVPIPKLIERKFIQVKTAGDCQVRVEAYQHPDGHFGFEKLELRRLIPPPVECFVRYPNYRGFLWADAPQTIKVWVNVRPEATDAELVVLDTAGAAMFSALFLKAGEQIVEIDARDWPLARYALVVQCAVGGKLFAYPEFHVVKEDPSGREGAHVDADGYLVTSEGRQFVLGAYDTGGFSGLESYYTPGMDHLAAAGGKVWLNYMLQNIQGPAFRSAIAAHAKRGMLFFQCWNRVFENQSNFLKLTVAGKAATSFPSEEAFWKAKAADLDAGARPGFLGWYIADELPADDAENIFRLYRTMAEAEPHGVCFGANNSVYGAILYRDAVDVLDIHTYPVYNTAEGVLAPMGLSYEAVKGAVDAVQGSRPVWAVLQDCILTSKGHYPTIDELRFMAWSAIVAGAKGIMWWSIGTQGGAIGGAPVAIRAALLQRLALVNAELVALEPALLSASAPATSSVDAVKVMAKHVDGVAHLWAANVSADEVTVSIGTAGSAVTITLPPFGVWLQAEPIDPVRRAAQAASAELLKAGLLLERDSAAASVVIAAAFDGFTRGGAA